MYKILVVVLLVCWLAFMFSILHSIWRDSVYLARIDRELNSLETKCFGAPIMKRPVWKPYIAPIIVTLMDLVAAGVMICRVVVWL